MSVDFRQSPEYLDIIEKQKQNLKLRQAFNPPHHTTRFKLTMFRKNNPDFDELYKEAQRLKMQKHRLNREHYLIMSKKQRDYNITVKERLFQILGGAKCIRCGFSDKRALQFDHINGGGTQDKLKHAGHLDRMRRYYLKHPEEARKNLQVLCANCNWIKRIDNIEHLVPILV